MLLGGRYRLHVTPLSTGNFGSVFQADDERMPRRVAVKILHPQHAANPTVRARFRRELEAACRVSHENVVSVFDLGEDDQLGIYYIMELVAGTALKDHLEGEPLPWGFVYRVAEQITYALQAIHEAGIIHRDLKPQNIMLVERPPSDVLVKVLDFGIASLKSSDDEKFDIELTGARMVLGTPPYMSPEQTYMRADRERLNLTVDARSDIYSLGVIFYEMVAGRRPFSGDAHDIVVAHRATKPMPLERMVGVSVPKEFAELTMRCLAKDPAERPQSAEELLDLLRACEHKPIKRWFEDGSWEDPVLVDAPTQHEHMALPAEAGQVSLAENPAALALNPEVSRDRGKMVLALLLGAIVAVALVILWPTVDAERPIIIPPDASGASAQNVAMPELAANNVIPSSVRTNSIEQHENGLTEGKLAQPRQELPNPVPQVVAQPETPPPSQIGLMLRIEPPGTVIFIDEEKVGESPLLVQRMLADQAELSLRFESNGFETRTMSLPMHKELVGQTLVIHETLKRKRERTQSTREKTRIIERTAAPSSSDLSTQPAPPPAKVRDPFEDL